MLLVNDSQTNLHGNEYISLGSEMVPNAFWHWWKYEHDFVEYVMVTVGV